MVGNCLNHALFWREVKTIESLAEDGHVRPAGKFQG